MRATFFTVCDAGYFPGTAAMVNSLRHQGHKDEVVVLDAGLTAEQSSALAQTCRVVPLPPTKSVSNPTFHKWIAPRMFEADSDVVVVIDGDMIVTKNVNNLLASAANGKIVGYPDTEKDAEDSRSRRFPEWQEIFGLPSAPRAQPYLCAGFIAFSTRHFPKLLREWADACDRICHLPTFAEGIRSGPTAVADQDALNAILMSRYPRDVLEVRPYDESPQAWRLANVEIVGMDPIRCRYRGVDTTILHQAGPRKPWREWRGLKGSAYESLMVHLLTRDSPVPVSPHEIVPWLRGQTRLRVAARVAWLSRRWHRLLGEG